MISVLIFLHEWTMMKFNMHNITVLNLTASTCSSTSKRLQVTSFYKIWRFDEITTSACLLVKCCSGTTYYFCSSQPCYFEACLLGCTVTVLRFDFGSQMCFLLEAVLHDVFVVWNVVLRDSIEVVFHLYSTAFSYCIMVPKSLFLIMLTSIILSTCLLAMMEATYVNFCTFETEFSIFLPMFVLTFKKTEVYNILSQYIRSSFCISTNYFEVKLCCALISNRYSPWCGLWRQTLLATTVKYFDWPVTAKILYLFYSIFFIPAHNLVRMWIFSQHWSNFLS